MRGRSFAGALALARAPAGVAALLCLLLALQGCAGTEPPREAGGAGPAPASAPSVVVDTLVRGCLANLGSGTRLADWARNSRFTPARAEFAAAIGVPAGYSTWVFLWPGMDVAMAFGGDGITCHVYARKADPEATRSLFIGVAEAARRPGILVEREIDREAVQNGRSAQQVGFRIRAEAGRAGVPDRFMLLTVNRAADARLQALGTASLVAGR
ncbi:NMCC_0638 family (lipo)protein [Muricoccus aerilatus]|uniref:NMCC_0638 family (lipo)protein n=1 Tax=Muricoccus aerilatus TaxID=452982 RepID=UPI0005C18AF1|nr:hypothetical protein [Roseomonas aerilata]